MSNGRQWTPADTLTLKRMAGQESDAEIGRRTGHCERTIRDRRNLLGLPAYAPRPKWTRRDYLLAGAAGLMENEAWA